VELNPVHLLNDSEIPFTRVKELRGFTNDEVIGYYFSKMRSGAQNK
jgi:hypothetical protein